MAKKLSRPQVVNFSALDDCDEAEIVEGYFDGRNGDPEPGDNRSYAYWHGWTKGACDGGHREATEADALLARDAIAEWSRRHA